MSRSLDELAQTLVLGALLHAVRKTYGDFEIADHWQQGEFHHDLVLRVASSKGLPGPVLVVATNCNGGVKEVLSFAEVPSREALWHFRCPQVPEFTGPPAKVLGRSTTMHWFDPCDLLGPDARSEYRAEFRARQPGGGWVCRKAG